MTEFITTQATKIATWGNSEAVRIPRHTLRTAGLISGDPVEIIVNERNNIEIVPKEKMHRRIKPARCITFDALFANYSPTTTTATNAWPDDNMVGAEFDAWSK